MSNGHRLREAPNRILAHLSQADFDLLATELETVDLPLRTKLESRGRPNDDVYFIESGFASVVAGGTGDRDIEVGLIGREGMTGLAVIMGTDRSPNGRSKLEERLARWLLMAHDRVMATSSH
jgi:CRP-like cAMP-binding protein